MNPIETLKEHNYRNAMVEKDWNNVPQSSVLEMNAAAHKAVYGLSARIENLVDRIVGTVPSIPAAQGHSPTEQPKSVLEQMRSDVERTEIAFSLAQAALDRLEKAFS